MRSFKRLKLLSLILVLSLIVEQVGHAASLIDRSATVEQSKAHPQEHDPITMKLPHILNSRRSAKRLALVPPILDLDPARLANEAAKLIEKPYSFLAQTNAEFTTSTLTKATSRMTQAQESFNQDTLQPVYEFYEGNAKEVTVKHVQRTTGESLKNRGAIGKAYPISSKKQAKTWGNNYSLYLGHTSLPRTDVNYQRIENPKPKDKRRKGDPDQIIQITWIGYITNPNDPDEFQEVAHSIFHQQKEGDEPQYQYTWDPRLEPVYEFYESKTKNTTVERIHRTMPESSKNHGTINIAYPISSKKQAKTWGNQDSFYLRNKKLTRIDVNYQRIKNPKPKDKKEKEDPDQIIQITWVGYITDPNDPDEFQVVAHSIFHQQKEGDKPRYQYTWDPRLEPVYEFYESKTKDAIVERVQRTMGESAKSEGRINSAYPVSSKKQAKTWGDDESFRLGHKNLLRIDVNYQRIENPIPEDERGKYDPDQIIQITWIGYMVDSNNPDEFQEVARSIFHQQKEGDEPQYQYTWDPRLEPVYEFYESKTKDVTAEHVQRTMSENSRSEGRIKTTYPISSRKQAKTWGDDESFKLRNKNLPRIDVNYQRIKNPTPQDERKEHDPAQIIQITWIGYTQEDSGEYKEVARSTFHQQKEGDKPQYQNTQKSLNESSIEKVLKALEKTAASKITVTDDEKNQGVTTLTKAQTIYLNILKGDWNALAPDYLRELFNLSPFYRHLIHNIVYIQHIMQGIIPRSSLEEPVLYLGAGPDIAERSWRVLDPALKRLNINRVPGISLDLAQNMLIVSEDKDEKDGIPVNQRPQRIHADLLHLPLHNKSFQTVEHASLSLIPIPLRQQALQEANRVLKDEGMLSILSNSMPAKFIESMKALGFELIASDIATLSSEELISLKEIAGDDAKERLSQKASNNGIVSLFKKTHDSPNTQNKELNFHMPNTKKRLVPKKNDSKGNHDNEKVVSPLRLTQGYVDILANILSRRLNKNASSTQSKDVYITQGFNTDPEVKDIIISRTKQELSRVDHVLEVMRTLILNTNDESLDASPKRAISITNYVIKQMTGHKVMQPHGLIQITSEDLQSLEPPIKNFIQELLNAKAKNDSKDTIPLIPNPFTEQKDIDLIEPMLGQELSRMASDYEGSSRMSRKLSKSAIRGIAEEALVKMYAQVESLRRFAYSEGYFGDSKVIDFKNGRVGKLFLLPNGKHWSIEEYMHLGKDINKLDMLVDTRLGNIKIIFETTLENGAIKSSTFIWNEVFEKFEYVDQYFVRNLREKYELRGRRGFLAYVEEYFGGVKKQVYQSGKLPSDFLLPNGRVLGKTLDMRIGTQLQTLQIEVDSLGDVMKLHFHGTTDGANPKSSVFGWNSSSNALVHIETIEHFAEKSNVIFFDFDGVLGVSLAAYMDMVIHNFKQLDMVNQVAWEQMQQEQESGKWQEFIEGLKFLIMPPLDINEKIKIPEAVLRSGTSLFSLRELYVKNKNRIYDERHPHANPVHVHYLWHNNIRTYLRAFELLKPSKRVTKDALNDSVYDLFTALYDPLLDLPNPMLQGQYDFLAYLKKKRGFKFGVITDHGVYADAWIKRFLELRYPGVFDPDLVLTSYEAEVLKSESGKMRANFETAFIDDKDDESDLDFDVDLDLGLEDAFHHELHDSFEDVVEDTSIFAQALAMNPYLDFENAIYVDDNLQDSTSQAYVSGFHYVLHYNPKNRGTNTKPQIPWEEDTRPLLVQIQERLNSIESTSTPGRMANHLKALKGFDWDEPGYQNKHTKRDSAINKVTSILLLASILVREHEARYKLRESEDLTYALSFVLDRYAQLALNERMQKAFPIWDPYSLALVLLAEIQAEVKDSEADSFLLLTQILSHPIIKAGNYDPAVIAMLLMALLQQPETTLQNVMHSFKEFLKDNPEDGVIAAILTVATAAAHGNMDDVNNGIEYYYKFYSNRQQTEEREFDRAVNDDADIVQYLFILAMFHVQDDIRDSEQGQRRFQKRNANKMSSRRQTAFAYLHKTDYSKLLNSKEYPDAVTPNIIDSVDEIFLKMAAVRHWDENRPLEDLEKIMHGFAEQYLVKSPTLIAPIYGLISRIRAESRLAKSKLFSQTKGYSDLQKLLDERSAFTGIQDYHFAIGDVAYYVETPALHERTFQLSSHMRQELSVKPGVYSGIVQALTKGYAQNDAIALSDDAVRGLTRQIAQGSKALIREGKKPKGMVFSSEFMGISLETNEETLITYLNTFNFFLEQGIHVHIEVENPLLRRFLESHGFSLFLKKPHDMKNVLLLDEAKALSKLKSIPGGYHVMMSSNEGHEINPSTRLLELITAALKAVDAPLPQIVGRRAGVARRLLENYWKLSPQGILFQDGEDYIQVGNHMALILGNYLAQAAHMAELISSTIERSA